MEEVVVRGVIGAGQEFLDRPHSRGALFGISLDKSISDRHLAIYFQWLLSRCHLCTVLVDDIEFRHNYVVFDRMNEQEATDRVLRRGTALVARIKGNIASTVYLYGESNPDDGIDRFLVRRSSEYIGMGQVPNVLELLTQAYKAGEEFAYAVDTQVDRSVGNRLERWRAGVNEAEYQFGRKGLAKFVLEETAITVDCVERGYGIELYRGTPIQVVVDLYGQQANKYPKLKKALNLRGQYGHNFTIVIVMG